MLPIILKHIHIKTHTIVNTRKIEKLKIVNTRKILEKLGYIISIMFWDYIVHKYVI